MKTIGAREANQNFSKILRAAEQGEEFLVTRNGRPAVRITPIHPRPLSPAAKKKAIARMIRLMKSAKAKIDRPITRDEMHER